MKFTQTIPTISENDINRDRRELRLKLDKDSDSSSFEKYFKKDISPVEEQKDCDESALMAALNGKRINSVIFELKKL